MPCRLCEQRLRKFKSKDFLSDERKTENKIINVSDYKAKWNAFDEMKVQLQSGSSVIVNTNKDERDWEIATV